MLSVYSPDRQYHVYCQECWLGDCWDGIEYGLEPDLSGPFFPQVHRLLTTVPLRGLFTVNNENSDYTNLCGGSKNCYLIFNSTADEDCYYLRGVSHSRDCLDVYFGTQNELCYQSINIHNCYNLFYSQNCYHCHDSRFLFNCTGCSDCFCSTNLKNKKYYFNNTSLGKDGYQQKMAEVLFTYSGIKQTARIFDHLVLQSIHRSSQNLNADDCSGDYLSNCKNCLNCFETSDSEDCAHCDSIKFAQDVYDAFGYSIYSELLYEVVAVGRSQRIGFSNLCSWGDEVYYSLFCDHCRNVFGCVGLKHKEYCILNKQYTKDQYQALLPEIIKQMQLSGEWGEFFPGSLSPMGYNQTLADEYYPLSRQEIKAAGFNWSDYQNPPPRVSQIIKAEDLPDDISDVPEQILSSGIECEVTRRPFRLIPQELSFSKRYGLPLPRQHPDQRYLERLNRRNPHRLWRRSCDNCSKDIDCSYAPQRPETVFCEECYRREVY